MKSKSRISTVVTVCALIVLGVGYSSAAQQKKSLEDRVTELEGKLSSVELELRAMKAELARTPRLGMQNAK